MSFGFKGLIVLFTHFVGLLWTSDQPVTKASTYTAQHGKKRTNIRVLSEIRTQDLSVQEINAFASDGEATETIIWATFRNLNNRDNYCEISGSHGGEYELQSLL
jgi:hypothetical protein